MTGALEINGKKMLSIKEAAKVVYYSRDHITRLARENKIVATHIGRNWFVDIDSLKNYEDVSKTELDIRKRHLSEERRRDLQVKEIVKEREKIVHRKNHASKKVATTLASAALVLGLSAGVWINSTFESRFSPEFQVANLTDSQSKSINPIGLESSGTSALEPVFETDSNLRTFHEADSGILLLPQFSQDNENRVHLIKDYFSDPVEVVIDENGETAVVIVDEKGSPVGESVPFVSVPINQTEQ